MFKKLFSSLALILAASSVNAELIVIVNKDNANALDSKLVQRIFLGKTKKFGDGSPTIPVNQSADSAIRQSFDETVVGRSSSQVSAYWSKLVFTGKGIPPKEVSSDAEVIDLVTKNPSVIGYIDSSSLTDSVKAVNL
ncbi:phosphate ABC transporter substrate-binding protein [Agaribacter flavus]|uniref:Phosphate ABC transporter substrate-binding protein n=1 Tax=Agaribacter flavus TaxID=1902781 RepID=A0ABV7FLU9_9ALTE